ncbi:uncharacterized protein B0T15DRAFT_442060 [Chaetomium strumarium]|uniref:Zn(2)-C6 fungal-type domain-containing protein n=1 Tax=Chaetomium strumarium TaxID=1170767 RepID=A0AAJ0GL20_9PEZI|nr:hypothetical protein B0T15DRAFT_442060 [Chaetomium strumarium]
MEDGTDEGESHSPSSTAPCPPGQTPVPRACDACRARKIRCNRESPCAHCVHAKIECTHAGANRPREKRSRILLTHQYEQKIDHIDRRLEGVVRLLEELKARLPPPTASASPAPTATAPAPATATVIVSASPASATSHAETPGSGSGSDTITTGTVVEGESSLTAHSVFANDFLQKAVSNKDSHPEMRERIDALRQMIEAMKKQPAAREMSYPHARPVRPAALDGCELPPIQKTLEVLKLAKTHKQLGALWVLDLFNAENLPQICLSAYMADDHNTAHFITAAVSLYYLFWIYGELFKDKQEEYLALSRVCRVNVETALSNLPLHLPANDDMVVALSLGTFYAIELAKPSLAWILSAKASELCQFLGYHRIGTYKNMSAGDAKHKQFLFWVVYLLDKSLTLRLGRSSTIQECDITVPLPSTDDPDQTPIAIFFSLWVLSSRLQGQIYELLYCPAAIAQPESVRKSRVQLLEQQLAELGALTDKETAKWDAKVRQEAGSDMADFFILSDIVLRMSTTTLVRRAVPNPPGSPTTFTADCIQAARETLAKHQECMAVVERSLVGLFSTYMSWTILYAPFVPFIVLFCQVIETKDRTDLDRLHAFVSSLQLEKVDSSGGVSDAIDKLRRLFQVLYSVATQYVDQSHTEAHQPSMEVDTCLAALGFPSSQGSIIGFGDFTSGTSSAAFQRGVNPMIWMGNGAQLEDWFYSNQQMMAFLEDGFPGEAGWGGGG